MRWNDRIGRRIKLSDLHILLAVAQSGSMAKAASQLAVSHPVVSRSISDLEHTLGVRLLERNPRGVELTEYRPRHAQPQPCRLRRVAAGRQGHRIPLRPDRRRGADRHHRPARRELRLDRHRPALTGVIRASCFMS